VASKEGGGLARAIKAEDSRRGEKTTVIKKKNPRLEEEKKKKKPPWAPSVLVSGPMVARGELGRGTKDGMNGKIRRKKGENPSTHSAPWGGKEHPDGIRN